MATKTERRKTRVVGTQVLCKKGIALLELEAGILWVGVGFGAVVGGGGWVRCVQSCGCGQITPFSLCRKPLMAHHQNYTNTAGIGGIIPGNKTKCEIMQREMISNMATRSYTLS